MQLSIDTFLLTGQPSKPVETSFYPDDRLEMRTVVGTELVVCILLLSASVFVHNFDLTG